MTSSVVIFVVHSRYICLARGACFTAGVPESGQTLTIWAGRALACARYTQDPNEERCRGLLDASGSAGVLSRGVGLRGFESHPPHHFLPVHTNSDGRTARARGTWSFVTYGSVRDANSTAR